MAHDLIRPAPLLGRRQALSQLRPEGAMVRRIGLELVARRVEVGLEDFHGIQDGRVANGRRAKRAPAWKGGKI